MAALKRDAAAWLLGISGRTLDGHVDAPRLPSGLYNARDLVAWWARRAAAAVAPSGPTTRDRIETAQAEKLEMKNAVARGVYVRREAAFEVLDSFFGPIRQGLDIFSRLHPEISAELEGIVRTAIETRARIQGPGEKSA